MDCEKRVKRFAKIFTAAFLVISSFVISTSAHAANKVDVTNGSSDSGVMIMTGSRINLVSRQSNIPVQIKNTYDAEIIVHLHGRALNPRAVVQAAVAVKLPPQTTVTAKLPVTAVANGQVQVKVWLESFSGQRLGEQKILPMNINADMEFTLLLAFGGGVIVLFTFGVMRQVRKNRRRVAADARVEI